MPKLPILKPKKLLAKLLKISFYIHHQTGSHCNLRHKINHTLHVVIPMHSRDLAPKTLKSIINQAEVTIKDII
jgi:predicted RNA binding protein YcfA (HicA-like mRNA interferase family)